MVAGGTVLGWIWNRQTKEIDDLKIKIDEFIQRFTEKCSSQHQREAEKLSEFATVEYVGDMVRDLKSDIRVIHSDVQSIKNLLMARGQ